MEMEVSGETIPNSTSEFFNFWSQEHRSTTLLSIPTTLNFCKILVCIQVLTPDLTLSGPLQPCQVTVIINLPAGTLPDMDIALVEVTVQAADHLS